MPLDLDDPTPTYLQIAEKLRRAIADGTYAIGARMPGVRVLAQEHQVAPATASKAIDVLRQDGLVVSRPGTGTVVRKADAGPAPTLQEQIDDLRQRVEALEAKRATR